MPERIDDELRYRESDDERKHKRRPVCDVCEELIEDDYFFLDPVSGAKICRDCLFANMKRTSNYMRWDE